MKIEAIEHKISSIFSTIFQARLSANAQLNIINIIAIIQSRKDYFWVGSIVLIIKSLCLYILQPIAAKPNISEIIRYGMTVEFLVIWGSSTKPINTFANPKNSTVRKDRDLIVYLDFFKIVLNLYI